MSLSDKEFVGEDGQIVILTKDVKEFVKILREELLEVVDDCISDWSYIKRQYHKKIDELAGDKLK